MHNRTLTGIAKFCSVGCLITILIVNLVLVGAFIGGSFYAYNTYAKPYTGIELIDALKIVKNAMSVDEDKIVTNPYDPVNDLNSFYKSFKDAAYISDDCNITLQSILDASGSVQDSNENPVNDDNIPIDENQTTKDSTSSFVNSIEFDKAKFEADFVNIDENNYIAKKLVISDKQVAAIVNELLNTAITKAQGETTSNGQVNANTASNLSVALAEDSSVEGGNDLNENSVGTEFDFSAFPADSISIAQSIISVDDPTKPDEAKITITVGIKLLEIVQTMLDEQQLPGIANSLINKATPEKIFVSLTVSPLDSNGSATFKINNMTEDDMTKLVSMTDNIASKSENESISLTKILNEINAKVVEIFTKINEMTGNKLFFVQTDGAGNMGIYPIETLIQLLNVENVTEAELMGALKTVCVVDETSLITNPYNSSADSQSLINQIKQKYAINSSYNITADNLMASETLQQLPNQINLYKDGFIFASNNDMKISITGQQLAALIASKLSQTKNTEDSIISGYDVNVVQCIISQTDTNQYEVTLTVYIDPKGKLTENDENSVNAKLIKAFLPDKLYISAVCAFETNVKGEIINLAYQENNVRTSICVNNADAQSSAEKLAVISRLLTSVSGNIELNIGDIAAKADKMIRDSMVQIQSEQALDCSLSFAKSGDVALLMLPSVYEVVQAKANLNDPTQVDSYVTSDEIREVLMAIYKDFDYATTEYSNAQMQTFLDTLNGNYFIKNDPAYLLNMDDFFGQEVSQEKIALKLNNNSIDFNSMFTSTKTNNQLKVSMENYAFAYAFNEKLQEEQIDGISTKILQFFNLTQTDEKVNMCAVIKAAVNANDSSYSNLLPNFVYITLSAPFNYTDDSKIVVNINDMNDTTRTNTIKIVNSFTNNANPINFDNLSASVKSSISKITENFTNTENFEISYIKDTSTAMENDVNVVFPSIYDFTTNILFTKEEQTASHINGEDVRQLMIGLNNYQNTSINDNRLYAENYITESDHVTMSPTIRELTDRNLGSLINASMKSASTKPIEGVKSSVIKELNILAGGAPDNSKARQVLSAWEKTDYANDYISMTMEVDMGYSTVGSDATETEIANEALISKLKPNKVYFHSITNMNVTDDNSTQIFINGLTTNSMNLMLKIVNKYSTSGTVFAINDTVVDGVEVVGITTQMDNFVKDYVQTTFLYFDVSYVDSGRIAGTSADVGCIGKLQLQ